jgi:hypothetical protein
MLNKILPAFGLVIGFITLAMLVFVFSSTLFTPVGEWTLLGNPIAAVMAFFVCSACCAGLFDEIRGKRES